MTAGGAASGGLGQLPLCKFLVSVSRPCAIQASVKNKRTELPDAMAQHLVFPHQHLRLCLVERTLVAPAEGELISTLAAD